MKYLIAFVFGTLLGVAAGCAAVFFNPLIDQSAASPPGAAWSLRYNFPEPSSMLLTHNRQLGMSVIPSGTPTLWETGIKGAMLNVLTLDSDAPDTVVLATRVGIPAADSNLFMQGALVDDYWLLTIPGQGSLFVHSRNNQWPLLRDTFVLVDLLDRPWSGSGPFLDRKSVV